MPVERGKTRGVDGTIVRLIGHADGIFRLHRHVRQAFFTYINLTIVRMTRISLRTRLNRCNRIERTLVDQARVTPEDKGLCILVIEGHTGH